MKNIIIVILVLFISVSCAKDIDKENTEDATTEASAEADGQTSASIVPDGIIENYAPKGFSDSKIKKALFVYADPRTNSLLTDMLVTSMKYLEDNGVEVSLRDLYAMNFNPVLSAEEFYYQKDGVGKPPAEIKVEQDLVSKADYIIFVYPNWHDTQNAMTKGYMERVFASGFAYVTTDNGPKGILSNKAMYTIMNAGFLGGGRGYIGDGIIDKTAWDKYMNAFKVLDDDTATWWGMTNYGRFVNDRTPKNNSSNYVSELNSLRENLRNSLNKTFLK